MRLKQHTMLVLIVVGLLASICAAENFTGKVAGRAACYHRLSSIPLQTAQAPNWLFASYFNNFRSYIPLAAASVLKCHFPQAILCLRYASDAAAKGRHTA